MEATKLYQELKERIKESKNILITTHIIPDADGIGSQIALSKALKSLKKKVFCVNDSKLIKRYHFLNKGDTIISLEKYLEVKGSFFPDLIIIVDTNKIARTGIKMSKYLSLYKDIIFIDHHPFSKPIKNRHFIDVKASATGEIIGNFIKALDIKMTIDMATAIYTAILIDTNTFRYPSVTANTHLLIAELLKVGISTTDIYNQMYGTKKIHHMHLLGHILSNTKTNQEGNLAWIDIKDDELKKFNSNIEDTHAYINNLLVLENVRVACMFREVGRKIKLSLRSHGDVDVAEIAQELGGGGHAHSAATVLEIAKGHDRDVIITNCLERIQEFLK